MESEDIPAVENTRLKRKDPDGEQSFDVWLGSVKIPSMANFLFLFIVSCSVMYKGLTSGLFYLIFRLVFGTLYPAYASYKAVRTKNVKEYVKWMMYWIVFALFSCAETFTDVFLSWFPFYYEIKIILVLWLLSPATKGSSILYRKFVHPTLSKREQEIDEYISKAKEQGYHTVLNLGTKGVNYATSVIMQTAIKGGGGLVNQIRKSYSLSDLTATDHLDGRDGSGEADDLIVTDPRLMRRRRSPKRSASGSPKVEMYFSEVDIRRSGGLDHIRSTDDISSGYSSAEPLCGGQIRKTGSRESLVRSGSLNAGTVGRPRTRSMKSAVTATSKKNPSTEESGISEDDADSLESDSVITIVKKPALSNGTTANSDEHVKSPLRRDSSDEGDFFDTVEPTFVEQKVEPEILINDTVVTSNVSVVNDNVSAQTNIKDDETENGNVTNLTLETNPCENENIPHPEAEKTNVKIDESNKEQESIDCEQKICEVTVAEPDSLPLKDIELDASSLSKQEIEIIEPVLPRSKESTPKPSEADPSDLRAGKYRKKTAPSPPEPQPNKLPAESDNPAPSQPIKATLVLKPGIVKPIESSNSTKSEIFVSRSPKPKRKESSSPIAKLKLLPKKFNFWHHKEPETLPPPDVTKRASWHDETGTLERSKKALNKDLSRSNEVLITQHDSGERVVGNLTVRQLSESPGRKKLDKD